MQQYSNISLQHLKIGLGIDLGAVLNVEEKKKKGTVISVICSEIFNLIRSRSPLLNIGE